MEQLKIKYNSTKTKIYACCKNCELTGHSPDIKYHLLIVPGKFASCFRCGFKSSYAKLRNLYSFDTSGITERAPVPLADRHASFTADLAANTASFGSSMFGQAGINYLRRRGVSLELVKSMNIMLGINKLYGRAVFVDKINHYYVARAFLPGLQPKTLNPTVAIRPLMYFDGSAPIGTLFLVEGCFDLLPFITAGKCAAALLGKDVSTDQMRVIKSAVIDNIVVALDADAFQVAIKLAGALVDALPLVNVGVVTYEVGRAKDPGEYLDKLFSSIGINWLRQVRPELLGV